MTTRKEGESTEPAAALHPRYEWFDEMRGMVSLLFMVSAIRGPLNGDPVLGIRPLGPPYLDHGFNYWRGAPCLITPIDLGQSMFIFILGFAGYLAFSSRLRRSRRIAIAYSIRRVAALYALAFFEAGGMSWAGAQGFKFNVAEFLYAGLVAKLAVAALCAYLSTYFIRSADRRVLLGVAIIIIHGIVYSFHVFDRYASSDNLLNLPKFPFGAMNLAAVSIIGAGFAQYIQMNSYRIQTALRSRVLPVSVAFLIGAYVIEWLQPSEQHDLTSALALLTAGLSGFSVCVAYGLEMADLQIPLLGALGRNLILTFLLFFAIVRPCVSALPKERLAAMPYVTLICVAVLPIAVMSSLMVFLDKRHLWLRL